jgi:hypothetical protein
MSATLRTPSPACQHRRSIVLQDISADTRILPRLLTCTQPLFTLASFRDLAQEVPASARLATQLQHALTRTPIHAILATPHCKPGIYR